jgi:putative transposase
MQCALSDNDTVGHLNKLGSVTSDHDEPDWEGSTTMTTRKRHSPEQVVRKLASADRMLGEGKDVADVCRELGVAEQTYYRWRNQFGGLKADDAKRLRELERENSTLKRLLAEAELEKAALKEIAQGNF